MKTFLHRVIALLILSSILGGCTSVVSSNPSRTATEELLLSMAADRAAGNLDLAIPKGSKIFIDASNFEATDGKYGIGAIRSHLLKQGSFMVDTRKDADVVIEIRSGALSTDNQNFLIGFPEFTLPIPFATTSLKLPEIAFYKSTEQRGVAKFAATSYAAKTGQFLHATEPQYGFSHNTKHTVFIFVSWSSNEALPDEDDALGKVMETLTPANDKN